MPDRKPLPAHLEARLYLLRALAHTAVLRRLSPLQHRCRAMLDLLEIDAARANNRKEFRSLRTEIRQRLEKLEARWARRERDALDGALSDLQSRLGMSALERDALRLCVRAYEFEPLREGLDGLTRGLASRVRLLARILNTAEQEARKLLEPENVLHRSGWLDAPMVESGLGECLRLQYETAELLLRAQPDGLDVLRTCCRAVGFGVRSRESFHEVRLTFDVIAALLHAALRARTVGVNVLIHPRPSAKRR